MYKTDCEEDTKNYAACQLPTADRLHEGGSDSQGFYFSSFVSSHSASRCCLVFFDPTQNFSQIFFFFLLTEVSNSILYLLQRDETSNLVFLQSEKFTKKDESELRGLSYVCFWRNQLWPLEHSPPLQLRDLICLFFSLWNFQRLLCCKNKPRDKVEFSLFSGYTFQSLGILLVLFSSS